MNILSGLAEMKRENKKSKNMKVQSVSAVRTSISFPPDLYRTLEEIARHKKVSLAWVVRYAAEKYVADRTNELLGPVQTAP